MIDSKQPIYGALNFRIKIMEAGGERRILAQFKTETGDLVGNPFELPVDLGVEKLRLVCNAILQQAC